MKQTCTDHCTNCGQHFHGMGAFETHLERINEHQNAMGARSYQLKHLEGSDAGLEVWTEAGVCELSFPTLEPVTIWRRIQTEAEKKRLATMAGKADSGGGSSRRAPETVSEDLATPVLSGLTP